MLYSYTAGVTMDVAYGYRVHQNGDDNVYDAVRHGIHNINALPLTDTPLDFIPFGGLSQSFWLYLGTIRMILFNSSEYPDLVLEVVLWKRLRSCSRLHPCPIS